MATYTIKEIEALVGIRAHTLRIWEQRYNLPIPKRTETNIRFYDDEDLKLLLNVAFLNKCGIRISDIAQMSMDDMVSKVMEYSENTPTLARQMQALTLAMLELNEESFDRLIATSILQMGLEKTMIHVVFPFMHAIGIMWQTGSINPAHEHFISNIIRQKLIVAIDGQSLSYQEDAKKFMLFLPEQEYHELGLLFASYVIRNRGHQCIYLGQNVPTSDLKAVYNVYLPDYVFTAITAPLQNSSVEDYINNLCSLFPESVVYATGGAVLKQNITLKAANLRIIHDFKEMINEISTDN